MLRNALTPPFLWITIALILLISTIVYWKRSYIKSLLRRLILKEISFGLFKFEFSNEKESRRAHDMPNIERPISDSSLPSGPNVSEGEILMGSISSDSKLFTVTETYRTLVHMLRKGKCRLFIGGGISSEVGLPSLKMLESELRSDLEEIGYIIAKDMTFPDLSSMYAQSLGGRSALIERLEMEFFEGVRERLWRHGSYHWIPQIPTNLLGSIYTSNWDDLLERAFEDSGKTVRVIREDNDLPMIRSDISCIVKLYGDFNARESLIITSSDYQIVKQRIREGTAGSLWGHLADQLARFHFIFVGQSLVEPPLDTLFQRVNMRVGEDEIIAPFFVSPMSKEEINFVRRWVQVRPISASAEVFFRELVYSLGKMK